MDQKKIGPERAAVCPRPHREAGKSQCWAQAAPSAGGVGGEQGPRKLRAGRAPREGKAPSVPHLPQ